MFDHICGASDRMWAAVVQIWGVFDHLHTLGLRPIKFWVGSTVAWAVSTIFELN